MKNDLWKPLAFVDGIVIAQSAGAHAGCPSRFLALQLGDELSHFLGAFGGHHQEDGIWREHHQIAARIMVVRRSTESITQVRESEVTTLQ
jgi:hypothetical protein